MGHWGSSVGNYYAEGWVSATGTGGNDTNWRIYAGTNNVGGDLYNLYINGVFSVGNASGSAGPNGISIGRWAPTNAEYSASQVSFVLAYNRVLTADEVLQNFSAMRGRFNI
jgi:hypothetical protein